MPVNGVPTTDDPELPVRLEGGAVALGGRPVLRHVDLTVRTGDFLALMGANGSGKSTLLRLAHGVQTLKKGTIERAGEVALLLQNPNDYLIHERVSEEAPTEALAQFGLEQFGDRDPRVQTQHNDSPALARVCWC